MQVEGNTALIYYSVLWILDDVESGVSRNPSRRFTVFRRLDGEWSMAGGSIAAVPN